MLTGFWRGAASPLCEQIVARRCRGRSSGAACSGAIGEAGNFGDL